MTARTTTARNTPPPPAQAHASNGKHPEPTTTQQKKNVFIKVLEQTGSVQQACAGAGISRQRAHEWGRADPGFAADRTRAKADQKRRTAQEDSPRTRFLAHLQSRPDRTIKAACAELEIKMQWVYDKWPRQDPEFRAKIDRHLENIRQERQNARAAKKREIIEQLRQPGATIRSITGPGKPRSMTLHHWRKLDPEFDAAMQQATLEQRMRAPRRFLAELERTGDRQQAMLNTGLRRDQLYAWRARYPEFRDGTDAYVHPRKRWHWSKNASAAATPE